MTLPPIDPSRSERHLLAALNRWARTNGWSRTSAGWLNTDRSVRIDPRPDGVVVLTVDERRWWNPRNIAAESVVQAVDLLVVYGYLPPLWSSAYALAVERYTEQIEALEADLDRKDSYLRSADDTIAGLMAENRELRQAAAHAQFAGIGGVQ